MTALLWPGDARAGEYFSDAAVVRAAVAVEAAWLAELAGRELPPGLVDAADLPRLAAEAETTGAFVAPLVALLRERVDEPLLHRGLTSQDVVDTALMLCARDAVARVRTDLAHVLAALAALADAHRATPMVARTLTQHAVPYAFGLKVAAWINALADADDDLAALRFPGQLGGAAGTLAATAQLTGEDPLQLVERVTARLDLARATPWHTARAPVTRVGSALAGVLAAGGRLANDVLVLARPEIAELAEPAGRGGSSTMPQKANPVLSVLLRRAALAGPGLAAQLQLAAGAAVDERPDGAWHLEWTTLQQLARHAVTAAGQLAELTAGLQLDPGRMLANLELTGDAVLAEQRTMAGLAGNTPRADYLGAADDLISAACKRADR